MTLRRKIISFKRKIMTFGRKKAPKEKPKEKRPRTRYEEITDQVYTKLEWYAKRFIIISVVGMVVGFDGLIYGMFAYYSSVNLLTTILGFQMPPLQDVSVFLGALIGIVSLAISLVLLALGIFWRIKVERRSIF
nr:hypothetical protein [Candidatus Freyarchaeota archaeon]